MAFDLLTGIHVMSVISGLVSLALYIVALTYIQKLENINCPCSNHPYRKWIKAFLVFSILFVGVNMFVPLMTYNSRNPMVALALTLLVFAFVVISLVFVYMAIIYIRFLVREKCNCSVDIRRNVIYIWSILLVVILLIGVFAILFSSLLTCTASAIVSTIEPLENTILTATIDPLKSLRDVPKSLSKSASKMTGDFKAINKSFSRLASLPPAGKNLSRAFSKNKA